MVGLLRELRFLIEYALVWPIVTLARSMSQANADRLIRVLGRLVYYVLANDRRWAYRNLDLVFGDKMSPEEKSRIVRKSFENIVRTRVEIIRWTKEWMAENVFEEGGQESIELRKQLDAEGKGLIFITGHLGNYELIPAYCYTWGFESTVMYRPQDNWRVERLLLGARLEYLPNVVRRSTIGLMTLGYVLRDAGTVGMLVDMNTLDNPVFVDYMGYPAASPPGAAALALSTGARVMLAVAIRQPDGKHRIIFHPPFETIRTGNKKEDIRRNTEQYMQAIESYALAYPDQYNWPHPRWRYRPDGSFWTSDQPVDEQWAERNGSFHTVADDPTPTELVKSRRARGNQAA